MLDRHGLDKNGYLMSGHIFCKKVVRNHKLQNLRQMIHKDIFQKVVFTDSLPHLKNDP